MCIRDRDKATVTVSIPKLPIDVDVVKKKKYPSGKYTTLILSLIHI